MKRECHWLNRLLESSVCKALCSSKETLLRLRELILALVPLPPPYRLCAQLALALCAWSG